MSAGTIRLFIGTGKNTPRLRQRQACNVSYKTSEARISLEVNHNVLCSLQTGHALWENKHTPPPQPQRKSFGVTVVVFPVPTLTHNAVRA